MELYKNPHLICEQINEEYYVCVNPLTKDWVKIITSIQKRILDLFEKHINIHELSEVSWYDKESLEKCANILSQKNIVNFSWIFEHDKRINTPNTLNLWVHTTDKCNLRCWYCYITTKDTHEDMDEEVTDILIRNIIETSKKHNLHKVTLRLSWWEPSIVFKKRMKKIDFLRQELKNHQCKLWIAFLTNGTIINEEQMEYIKGNKLGIAVSLDWIWEYHDKNRFYINGKGCFNDVEKKLEEMIEKWLKPTIMTVISNENMDWLVELTEFLIKKNLPFRYSFVQWKELDQEKLLTTMNQCYDLLEKATDDWYKFSELHKLCDLKFLSPYFQTCICWFSWWAIYLDGGMYFCHVNFWDQDNNGNIRDNKDIFELIAKWKDKLSKLSEDCINCHYQYICTWWCPVERKDWKDPHCNTYRALIPRVYKIIGKEKVFKILNNKT